MRLISKESLVKLINLIRPLSFLIALSELEKPAWLGEGLNSMLFELIHEMLSFGLEFES